MVSQCLLHQAIQLSGFRVTLDLAIPLIPVLLEEPVPQLRKLIRAEFRDLLLKLFDFCHASLQNTLPGIFLPPSNGPTLTGADRNAMKYSSGRNCAAIGVRCSVELDAIFLAPRTRRDVDLCAIASPGRRERGRRGACQSLGEDATVITIAVDSGLRYLSTDLYRA